MVPLASKKSAQLGACPENHESRNGHQFGTRGGDAGRVWAYLLRGLAPRSRYLNSQATHMLMDQRTASCQPRRRRIWAFPRTNWTRKASSSFPQPDRFALKNTTETPCFGAAVGGVTLGLISESATSSRSRTRLALRHAWRNRSSTRTTMAS